VLQVSIDEETFAALQKAAAAQGTSIEEMANRGLRKLTGTAS